VFGVGRSHRTPFQEYLATGLRFSALLPKVSLVWQPWRRIASMCGTDSRSATRSDRRRKLRGCWAPTCVSSDLACWRNCAQPPVVVAICGPGGLCAKMKREKLGACWLSEDSGSHRITPADVTRQAYARATTSAPDNQLLRKRAHEVFDFATVLCIGRTREPNHNTRTNCQILAKW
jgi:hypothetical protein